MKSVSPLRVLTAALIAVGGLAGASTLLGGDETGWVTAFFSGVVAVYLVIGTLIIERQPANPVGRIVYLLGLLVGYYLVADAFIRSAPSSGADVAAWSVGLLDGVVFLLMALLFIWFPDGRLPSPRWRLIVALDIALAVVVVLGTAVRPGPFAYYPQFSNPFATERTVVSTIADVAYMAMLVVVAASALSLIGRFRRGGPVERAQLKWVALAAIAIATVMVAYGVLFGPGAYNEIADLAVSLALGFFPITIGIAILRYHLFEIDRLVSRGIAYGLLTAVLVGTYGAVILLLQGPLGAVLGGDTISVALSTLVVAALFQPLRGRLQRAVDRRFDRARFDAERTSAAFSERLRDEMDIAAVTTDLDATIRTALKPTSLGLWLRGATDQ